jgi:hypothetical protein
MKKLLVLFLILAPALMAAQRQVFLETIGEEWCTYCRCAWHTFERIQGEYPPGQVNTIIWSGDVEQDSYMLRYKQYKMQGTPYTYVDGVIEKVGAWGSGSSCKGDNNHCMYDWFMGNDNAACKLQNNQGVTDRMAVAAPLSVAIGSSFDESSLAGTLTVTVTLDASIAPASGTVNLITVLLYQRGLTSKYGTDNIFYPQVVRASLLTEQVTVTDPGQQQTFTVDFLLDPSWPPADMGVLAFVQNYTGSMNTNPKDLKPKEILNSGFLGDLTAPPADTGHIRPVSRP